MRHFHKTNNKYHCPTVNLDRVWTLVTDQVCGGRRLLPFQVWFLLFLTRVSHSRPNTDPRVLREEQGLQGPGH